MSTKIKFRLVPQDEFDARYPEVNESVIPGHRIPGEVQVPGIQGWCAASVFRGVPDRYWHEDEWVNFGPDVEFVRAR